MSHGEADASKPSTPESVVAVIPARIASTRLPEKPLQLLGGRPLIAHVVARALEATRVGRVLVATDDERVAEAAHRAGASAYLSAARHPSGSDRIAEAIGTSGEELVLNIQGDEALVPPWAIDRLVELLDGDPLADLSTLATPLAAGDPRIADPNVVKVVRAEDGRALYFSRAPIPASHPTHGAGQPALRHGGLYGYRRAALERFVGLAPSPLEKAEGLEQLRALEAGMRIVVGVVDELPGGVDTADDLARCAAILAQDPLEQS